MRAVADTSSLLSLEFMGILDEALGIAEVHTTGIVEDELKESAGFNDEKSRIAKRVLKLIQSGKIKRFDVKSVPYSKYVPTNTCLGLCISGKIPFLITDDADAAYYLGRTALQKGIKIRTCTAVLMELIRSGRLSRSAAKEKLEELIQKRSWEGGVLEVLARRYLEEGGMW